MMSAQRNTLSIALGLALLLMTAGAQAQSRGIGGACCLPDGTCDPGLTEGQCEQSGGIYQGDQTQCPTRGGEQGVNCQPFIPDNDDCENATPIKSLGVPVAGSSFGASEDDIPNCENRNGFTPNGVWYSVIGTGSVMRVGVCQERLSSRGGRSFLFVFCGDCDSLECIVGDGGSAVQSCDNGDRILEDLEWCAELGREYLIFVSFESEPNQDFMIEVNSTDQACKSRPCGVENDDCEDAIRLMSNDTVQGTVDGATPSDAENCFDDRGNNEADVWYSVIGTGGVMEAELCIPILLQGKFEGALDIYCGDCDNLQCVAAESGLVFPCDDDDDLGVSVGDNELEVEWCAEEGREYFIRVSLSEDFRGVFPDFVLEVENEDDEKCIPEPCGVQQEDFCRDAQCICPGIVYEGHTFDATSAYFDHGGPIESIFFCGMLFGVYDVWYKYVPDEDGLLFVHVEGPPTEYVFGVYDSCDEVKGNLLVCNVTRHHGVIVWPVEECETYYIRIAGTNFSRGEFVIDLVAPDCKGEEEPMNLTQ